MRGAQKAQPFGHPLDGRVRRRRGGRHGACMIASGGKLRHCSNEPQPVKRYTPSVTVAKIFIRPRFSAGADIVTAVAVIRAWKEPTGHGQEEKSRPSLHQTEPSAKLKLTRGKPVSAFGGDIRDAGGTTRGHEVRRLTFDMRGDRKAQPFGHPLDGRVRRQRL